MIALFSFNTEGEILHLLNLRQHHIETFQVKIRTQPARQKTEQLYAFRTIPILNTLLHKSIKSIFLFVVTHLVIKCSRLIQHLFCQLIVLLADAHQKRQHLSEHGIIEIDVANIQKHVTSILHPQRLTASIGTIKPPVGLNSRKSSLHCLFFVTDEGIDETQRRSSTDRQQRLTAHFVDFHLAHLFEQRNGFSCTACHHQLHSLVAQRVACHRQAPVDSRQIIFIATTLLSFLQVASLVIARSHPWLTTFPAALFLTHLYCVQCQSTFKQRYSLLVLPCLIQFYALGIQLITTLTLAKGLDAYQQQKKENCYLLHR